MRHVEKWGPWSAANREQILRPHREFINDLVSLMKIFA